MKGLCRDICGDLLFDITENYVRYARTVLFSVMEHLANCGLE